jgi:hypothetical protein
MLRAEAVSRLDAGPARGERLPAPGAAPAAQGGPEDDYERLYVVASGRRLAENLAANTRIPIRYTLGLDAAQLGRPAAFWCPQVWAARLLAGGATHPFLSPGPVWLARIPQQFLGRRLRSGRLGDLLGHDWHRPLFVRAAEYESFPFSARIHPDAASLRAYVEAAFPGRPLAELRALATIVSQPAEFVQEFRCFIAEGQVTAASQYLPRQGDSNAPWQSHGSQDADTADARRFAHDVCDAMGQDQAPGYTLDVGRLADGHWAVVEANPAWSSDPHHGDPDGAVASVLASQRRCNEWAWRPDPLLSSLP